MEQQDRGTPRHPGKKAAAQPHAQAGRRHRPSHPRPARPAVRGPLRLVGHTPERPYFRPSPVPAASIPGRLHGNRGARPGHRPAVTPRRAHLPRVLMHEPGEHVMRPGRDCCLGHCKRSAADSRVVLDQFGRVLHTEGFHETALVEFGGTCEICRMAAISLAEHLRRRVGTSRCRGVVRPTPRRPSITPRRNESRVPRRSVGRCTSPLESFLDGRNQFGGRRVFQDEAGCPSLEHAPSCVRDLAVHGQENHFRPRPRTPELACGVDPVERRHRDIEDDDIGVEPVATLRSSRPSDTIPITSK